MSEYFINFAGDLVSLGKRESSIDMSSTAVTADSNLLAAAGPSGVDGAVGVPDAKWFVAIVNPRHEKAIADKLMNINVTCYVASQKEFRIWKNGRRKTIDRVVIPSMVFVHCSEKQRRLLVTLPFINRFLVNRSADSGGLNKPVAVIDDKDIQKLKFMLGQSDHHIDFIPTPLKVNDSVRVIRGSLRGLVGQISRSSDGSHKLMVNFQLLGGASVSIDPHDVEKIAEISGNKK